MTRHLVWDWNGTLLDDQPVVIAGLNAVLADAGLPFVDLATYQRLYTRPVQVFYERLFGRPIPPEEWERVDEVFHQTYRDQVGAARLARDATEALQQVVQAGGTQSLLSMYRHDELLPLVEGFGIAGPFLRVDGLRGAGGGRKAPYLRRHLDRVAADRGGAPERVLVVGDALDDARAAAAVGVECVLYDGGSHPREQLEEAGVPVAGSLTEALELADWA